MLKIKITVTSLYFKYSTYVLLHLQSMVPPPIMLTMQHFSLHGYEFMVHIARYSSFPVHSRVGIPQSSVLYGFFVS